MAYTLYAPPLAARLSEVAAKQQLSRDHSIIIAPIGCPNRFVDVLARQERPGGAALHLLARAFTRTTLVFRARNLSEFPATPSSVADIREYCFGVRRAGKTFSCVLITKTYKSFGDFPYGASAFALLRRCGGG